MMLAMVTLMLRPFDAAFHWRVTSAALSMIVLMTDTCPAVTSSRPSRRDRSCSCRRRR